ncbi:MAG TPA: restriction endonuclease [Ktedonobacterales bacterium]|nr:restriction endonuclease [Ktedonobacterales bacterium]
MRQRYDLGSEAKTAMGYFQLVARMGYLESQRNGTVILTARALQLLQTRDTQPVLDALMRECLGTYDILEAVGRLGSANGKSLLTELGEQFPFWTTSAQFVWRLQWLYSLGCIEKVEGGYIITLAGQSALQMYGSLLSTADSITPVSPSNAVPIPPLEVSEDSFHEEATPAVSEATEADSPPVLVIRDGVERLAERIRSAALESSDATGFERVIREAFQFLGFVAEHKSGSGDTDVLVTAALGQETYRSIVDGKSSRHGRVGNQQINWLALERHKSQHKADYILVVAPSFSSGDLLDDAVKTDASLLSANDLAAVVRLHASTPLSLIDLRELFRYAGRPELPLQRVQERAAEVARLQRLLPDILRTFEHSYRVGVSGPIAADSLHLILARDYGRAVYTKDEIVAGLELLSAPLVGALRKVTDTAFALQMPIISVGRRFQAQARQLLEAAETPILPVAMDKDTRPDRS